MRRLLRLGFTLACVATLCTSCAQGNGSGPTSYVGYRVGADDRTIVVVVLTGPLDEIAGGTVVSEDESTVTVEVNVDRYRDVQPDVGVYHDITVMCAEPLATREVRTVRGQRLHLLP